MRRILVPYTRSLVNKIDFSIVLLARRLSGISSQVQQEIEFIRPMVEERFAKTKEDWDEEPVCQTVISGIPLDG